MWLWPCYKHKCLHHMPYFCSGLVRQKTKPDESMSEGYLLQKIMEILHNEITLFDEFAPKVWNEEEDEACNMGICICNKAITTYDFCFVPSFSSL